MAGEFENRAGAQALDFDACANTMNYPDHIERIARDGASYGYAANSSESERAFSRFTDELYSLGKYERNLVDMRMQELRSCERVIEDHLDVSTKPGDGNEIFVVLLW